VKIYLSRTVALPRSLLSPAFHHLRPTTELNALSPGATPSRTLAPLHTNVGQKSLQQPGPLLQDSRSEKDTLHRQAELVNCLESTYTSTPRILRISGIVGLQYRLISKDWYTVSV
jgi:hypothetical protein